MILTLSAATHILSRRVAREGSDGRNEAHEQDVIKNNKGFYQFLRKSKHVHTSYGRDFDFSSNFIKQLNTSIVTYNSSKFPGKGTFLWEKVCS